MSEIQTAPSQGPLPAKNSKKITVRKRLRGRPIGFRMEPGDTRILISVRLPRVLLLRFKAHAIESNRDMTSIIEELIRKEVAA